MRVRLSAVPKYTVIATTSPEQHLVLTVASWKVCRGSDISHISRVVRALGFQGSLRHRQADIPRLQHLLRTGKFSGSKEYVFSIVLVT